MSNFASFEVRGVELAIIIGSEKADASVVDKKACVASTTSNLDDASLSELRNIELALTIRSEKANASVVHQKTCMINTTSYLDDATLVKLRDV